MKNLGNWLDARTDYRRLIAPLRQRTIPGGPGWWLTSGSCLFWLLVTELVTGLALMTTYSPSMAAAWASVHFIDASAAGAVLRGVHYYTSHALIVIFLVHVARVVWSAAFRAPRELIWMTGLLLMPLTIVWALTGNPLSANQKGMGQIEVEGKILASTPWIGPAIQRILIGGDAPGNLTLTHLYFLHVGLLPLLAGLLLAVHISQVYRHGLSPRGQQPPGGPAVAYWPHQSVRNLVVLSLVMAVVVWLAWRYGAPLDAPADPNLPQSPRPEWYFRWLFELRRYFTGPWEFLATLVLPLALLFYFLLLPAVDRRLTRQRSAGVRLATVIVGIGAWGWLTWASLARDWNDAEYLAAQREGRELAERARVLAAGNALPSEGAVTLLRNDPQTQGPLLFRRHCAGCHSHADGQGSGIVAHEPSAPNLYGFATPEWIAGFLDPEKIASPDCFGRTKFAAGEMAGKLRELHDESDDVAVLRQQLALVARALSAEARLPAQSESDRRDARRIAAGGDLMRGDLGCTDCHRSGSSGELGSAPDLTGYGSREWLAGMIGNPQHERFYPGEHNDRMPAFARDLGRPEQNVLSRRELELLVAWLRGEWRQGPSSADDASRAEGQDRMAASRAPGGSPVPSAAAD